MLKYVQDVIKDVQMGIYDSKKYSYLLTLLDMCEAGSPREVKWTFAGASLAAWKKEALIMKVIDPGPPSTSFHTATRGSPSHSAHFNI